MQILRLNVLISAHELNPFHGSESATGWNIVSRLGKYHNVTVLYARGNQFNPDAYENALNEYFSQNPNPYNIRFIPIGQSKAYQFIASINKLLSKKSSSIGNPLLYHIVYNLWQKKAFKVANELCKNSKFDIIHHLTSITFREPGYLWKLPIPFVWGPTGGMRSLPIQFYKFIGLKSSMIESTRYIINKTLFNLNIRINKAVKKSSIIYNFSLEDQFLFSKKSGKKTKLLLDSASIVHEQIIKKSSKDSKQLSVVWCGSLIKRKALEIILFAISSDTQLKEKIKLIIVGSGSLEYYYKTLSKNLNIDQCIEWIGHVDHSTVFNIMNDSDLFVHSSYREATSHVVLEALSMGLPVICHDINGMSIAINDKCGIKVPNVSPEVSIEGFKNAILKLVTNSSELEKLKIGAFQRAKELTWDAMTETIANDYVSICK